MGPDSESRTISCNSVSRKRSDADDALLHGRGIEQVEVVPAEMVQDDDGVEPDEGQFAVDEVLGEDAGDDGLADSTLFAPDEMDFRHESCSATEEGAMKRWLFRWDG